MKPTKTKLSADEQAGEQFGRRPRRGLRRFRLWEKKRGSHQTGSSWWGGAGETIFFAVLFLIGVATLTQLVWLRVMVRTETFLTSNWGLLLSILLLGSLIVIGAVGAIYSVLIAGTSAERRAALAKRAADNELLAEVQQSSVEFPSIPDDSNWKNSPGIRLAYRLPSGTSASWRLVVVASCCLAWNGAVAVLAVFAFHLGDSPNTLNIFDPHAWTLFRFVVAVYGLIGVFVINWLLRMLLTAAAIGPTSLEISALPLYPGKQYRVFLAQAGHVKIDWLEMRLVCDEEVSFSDGTDTRVESNRVYEQSVFRHEDFEIVPSAPFHCDCSLDVPAQAMHSFVAANNAVTWKLVVQIQPQIVVSNSRSRWSKLVRAMKTKLRRFVKTRQRRWPPIVRVYPLVLHPAHES